MIFNTKKIIFTLMIILAIISLLYTFYKTILINDFEITNYNAVSLVINKF